jgi:hypothetical protein
MTAEELDEMEQQFKLDTRAYAVELRLLAEVRRLQRLKEDDAALLHDLTQEREALRADVDGWFKAAGEHENAWLDCQKQLYEVTQEREALQARVAELEQARCGTCGETCAWCVQMPLAEREREREARQRVTSVQTTEMGETVRIKINSMTAE